MATATFQGRVVFCTDVDATALLYEQHLGFQRMPGDDDGDVSLRAGVAGHPEASVEFLLHASPGQPGTDLGNFAVEDVDAAVRELAAAGCTVTGQPNNAPWGVREATVADVDGNGLTLFAPLPTALPD